MTDSTTIELPNGLDLDTAKDVLREFATTDDAQIVSADTLSAKDEKIDELAGVYRDALQQQKDLSEEAVNGMSIDALTAEFRNDDGELEADTLAQNPETGTANTGGDGGNPDVDNLERIEQIRDKLDTVGNALPDERVDALHNEAADLAGADDYDGALEVL